MNIIFEPVTTEGLLEKLLKLAGDESRSLLAMLLRVELSDEFITLDDAAAR